MKQTPVCILCDWLISNSTSKDDAQRWMSKNSCYAPNTEHGYKNIITHFQATNWRIVKLVVLFISLGAPPVFL